MAKKKGPSPAMLALLLLAIGTGMFAVSTLNKTTSIASLYEANGTQYITSNMPALQVLSDYFCYQNKTVITCVSISRCDGDARKPLKNLNGCKYVLINRSKDGLVHIEDRGDTDIKSGFS